jgi:transposase-like protein
MLKGMYVLNQVPSEAQIRKYLRKTIFGSKIHCPECGSRNIIRMQERYRCRECRTKFSLLSHTWLKDLKLSLPLFWLVCWCWVNEVSVQQCMKLCRLSEDAVRRWYERFRLHLPHYDAYLRGTVQMDEAYFKGWSLMMAKDSHRSLAHVMIPGSSVQRHHASIFLERYVEPDSRLYTDGASIYRGIEHWWPVIHEADIHRKFEFAHTSQIEGTFGNLRTFIRRMYHHVTPAKLPSVVTEFSLRFCQPDIFESPDTYLSKSLKLTNSWPN